MPSTKPEPTLDEMIEGVEALWTEVRCIGHLHGEHVMLNPLDRTLSVGDVKCSVDHPYLIGTPMREAALRALGEKD